MEQKRIFGFNRKISGSLIAYERYLDSKNKNTTEHKLPVEEAKKLMDYINKNIKKLENGF